MRVIYFFLVFFSFLSCQVEIRQVPAPREYSVSKVSKISTPIHIGKFEIYSADRKDYLRTWRVSFLSYIKSNRIFSEAYDITQGKEIGADDYILDIFINPKFDDTYDYWWTWPAIYPMVGYWPVQIRKAKYDVYINYTISKGNKEITKGSVMESGRDEVTFYGFYRTSSMERMIEVTNLMAMEKCIREIESAL